ncbi:4-aminobutyrate---pyruvate transaminase [Enhydrobacter aerosaccus]|uniref:4-aminobutyrate---pyruvate transaminase n=1 Tax=Enhydrobacter aerosaccus TaxID=225324 RepID=A0A1T4JKW1_9HYPH|nr:aminotransferase class III-fold pyridoxal phosphate-dependent enzyme [Enhydrobacter aerosaccus]SJZ30778.1 4-aminobutyrate---pyruvate transaminase [Enhydrobacter aerosaccus]
MDVENTLTNAGSGSLLIGFSNLRRARGERPLVITKGRGVFIADEDGREILDASSSFYCAALGYSDTRLVEAARRQLGQLPFYTTGMHRTVDVALELAEKLKPLVPIADAHVAIYCTGSEAVDFALKFMRYRNVARGEPQRRKVISRWGSYHGGTIASAALGGGRDVHDAFALPMDDFLFVSQPNWPAGAEPGESEAQYVGRLIAELEQTIEAAGPETVAGFVAEPISFSCGFFPPPAGYFAGVREVLDRHGILYLDDEVICGYGRTGHLFAAEPLGLKPDMMSLAKGMTSGYFPVSATIISGELYDWLERGSEQRGTFAHATTASGHPVGAAVALEMLRIVKEDRLLEQVQARIPSLHRHVHALADHPLVGAVRAFGLAGALTLTTARIGGIGAGSAAGGVAMMGAVGRILGRVMLDHGLIVRITGDNAVIAPPLIIQESEIDELFRRLRAALDDAAAELMRG